MSQNNFFNQLFLRLTSKSPKFFVIIQWISIICAAIVGLPELFLQFGIDISFVNEPYKTILAVAGAVGFVISKLPVSDDSKKIDQVSTK